MQFCIILFIHNFMQFHQIFILFLHFIEDLKLKITTDYGAEFVVPFFSGSRFYRSQVVIKMSTNDTFFSFKMRIENKMTSF